MTKSDEAPSYRIAPEQLDGMRRQAGLEVGDANEGWTACSAPSTTLVLARDGAWRGCQSATADLAAPATPAATAWRSASLCKLRGQLGEGTLDADHCRSCIRWFKDELEPTAPPLRDHDAAVDLERVASGPSKLIIRLPLVADAHARALTDIESLLPQLDQVVLEADRDEALSEVFAKEVLDLLKRHQKDSAGTLLSIQTPCSDADAVRSALAGYRVHALTCVLDRAADAAKTVAEFAALADELGAERAARFVFTTHNWFEFEEHAKACAQRSISLELRVLAYDGHVPLAELAADELNLLRDVVAGTSSRCTGDSRHASLTRDAHAHVTHEMRQVLRRRTELELADEVAEGATLPLQLPPPEHAWCTAPELRGWWLPQLFGRAYIPAVRTWLFDTVGSHHELLQSESGTWLRVMVQRLARDQHLAELLDLLRGLYADAPTRQQLIAWDDAFAADFDLTRFGGPWAESLGLLHDRSRQRPFAFDARDEQSADAPDITVLIPSYRHELYIEETLQSVLAQRYGNFRVLVVDDRSPDATVEKARSINDARIDVRINEQNLGLGNSVLQALEQIDTPYVALLNSDDLFHPDRLGKCRDVLEQHASVQLVTTGIDLVDQDGGELTPQNASLVLDGKKVFDWVQWFDRVTPPDDLPQDELFAALLERNFLVTSSNLVARTDWLRSQANGLKSLKYCLDWQLFLESALEGSLHHLHEPLIAYRLHASNTVWFREGRRWSYYLEVNRVAAEALQRFLAQDRLDSEHKLHQVVDSVARHLATNTEMDGLALFLNCALDALQLDDAAANRPDVQELIEALNLRAEKLREAAQHYDDAPSAADEQRRLLRILLGTLADEQQKLERNQKHWLRGYAESLEKRIATSWQERDRLEIQLKALHENIESRREYANNLEGRLEQVTTRFEKTRKREELAYLTISERDKKLAELHQMREQQLDELRKKRDTQLDDLRKKRDAQADKTKRVRAELEGRLQAARDDFESRLTARRKDLEEAQARLAEKQQRIEQATKQLGQTQEDLATERSARAETQQSLAAANESLEQEKSQAREVVAAKEQVEGQRNELLHKVANLNEEIDRLGKTREFRTGNFIWNKMPLGYMSRRGKKWYRRLMGAKDRVKMKFKSRGKTDGTAVVAACWSWPIYSHTFVYQEMCSLNNTGLDVQLFHWDLGSTDQLHAAFQYLYDNRTQLQPVWESHKKDMEYFEKTKPGKLRSFLERISPLCGKSVEELEQESIVRQGCTFARMAELANARYLHSYFFYDQSFMAMQAAWLLDLPRGVSCYADHMMDDYPWKFVPLHIELCDVIVATSARIKQELSGLSGGKFDDKIVVKPNGVDGERFVPRERGVRKPDEPFEVLSVSRIEPKKGLTHLVEAIADLKKRGHTVIAHIIGAKDEHSKGSLEYAAEFEACIVEHGMQEQVILHGMMKQEEMPPIIEKCRAFVAPYVETESGDKDGIPTAMLEALASSLPVITTNSGSIVEVIDDGVEGIVVGQRDSLGFANALEKVLTDSDLELKMAKNARARFDKDFDIKVTEKRLHERIAGFLAAKA